MGTGGNGDNGSHRDSEASKGEAFISQLLSVAGGDRRQPKRATPPASTDGEIEPHTVRVGFYARYSSHLQDDGYSIESQHEAVQQEAAARARQGETWEIRYYDEPARSAKAEKLAARTVFLDMLRDAVDGRLDIVCVGRLDRLARALKVQLLVLDELAKHGVGFVSIRERMSYTTATGRFVMQQMGAIAEFDNNVKGETVAAAKAARARRGLHAHHAPYGYRVVDTKEPLVPDIREGETDELGRPLGNWFGLQELFRLALTGLSNQEIAERLNADGRWYVSSPTYRRLQPDGTHDRRRPFTLRSVFCIRANVFYRPWQPGDTQGTLRHGQTLHRGAHVAGCTWEEWHAIQTLAGERRQGHLSPAKRNTAVPHTAEFRGLAVCAECGGRLYITRSIFKHATSYDPDHVYVYEKYGCMSDLSRIAHPRRYTRVEDVREQWIAWASEHLRFPPDFDARIRAYALKAQSADNEAERSGELLMKEEARWLERKRRATRAYLDGLIDDDEHSARVREADERLESIRARLNVVTPTQVREMVNAAKLLTNIAEMWPVISTERRIAIATQLIESGGMRIKLLPQKGKRYTRWDIRPREERPPTCELVEVRLREPYNELLKVTTLDVAV